MFDVHHEINMLNRQVCWDMCSSLQPRLSRGGVQQKLLLVCDPAFHTPYKRRLVVRAPRFIAEDMINVGRRRDLGLKELQSFAKTHGARESETVLRAEIKVES